MRRIRIFAFASLVVLAASLLLARVHPFGDAGLYANNPSTPFLEDAHIPADVRSILETKCASCHSAQVRAPIYGHFAPISWLMERDVVRARKAVNLSRWNSYTEDQRFSMGQRIVAMAREGKMPLLEYRLVHWKSRISDGDVLALTRWADAQSATKEGDEQSGSSEDSARGRELFIKRCMGCHSLTEDREGPRLGGVFGRRSGSVPTFEYSVALKKAHIVWNEATLEKWLANPDQMAPGTDMDFYVPNTRERQEIIRYLKSGL
jgi:cytochrome c